MENFKKQIQKRQRIFIAGIMAAAALMIVFSRSAVKSSPAETYPFYLMGFSAGFSMALTVRYALLLGRYRKILNDETELKKLYNEENDERNRMISEKSGGMIVKYCAGVIVFAGLVSSFFSMIVMSTLMACAFFLLIVRKALMLYYSRKF
ncbi:MAG: hypothetical protein LBC56_06525 [Oscillospiraceae bacterium]|jgi:hypothetical protein|nr:hypothetical protein [Oscillospiraceae bacterium]